MLITEGPIFKGNILEIPRIGVINIHAAPLPYFRGNWTTFLSLYCAYPPMVSAHIVMEQVDAGSLIDVMKYDIYEGDTLEEVNQRASRACMELAAKVIRDALDKGVSYRRQRIWEGHTYKGCRNSNGVLMPAMSLELQDELKQRMELKRYGFYTEGDR